MRIDTATLDLIVHDFDTLTAQSVSLKCHLFYIFIFNRDKTVANALTIEWSSVSQEGDAASPSTVNKLSDYKHKKKPS